MTSPADTLSKSEFYRKLHTGNSGDADFYQRVTKGAARILELGCGWGRLASALLNEESHYSGVDLNEDFVELARKEYSSHPKAQFITGDILDFSFTKYLSQSQYDRVILPYNTVYALGGKKNVLRCFTHAANLLAPQGELWFDVYPVDEMQRALDCGEEAPEDDGEPVAEWNDGTLIYERSEIDHKNQEVSVTYEARNTRNQKTGRLPMKHNYLLTEELLQLIEKVNLKPLGQWGSFAGAPLDEDTEQVIFGASRQ